MKKDLIQDFNLPNYVKGKSFAEASKAIEKKFSERTDIASNQTKEELMGRLAKAQEFVKMQESLKANSQQVPDMMNGQVPQGFEEFAPQNQMFEGGFADMDATGKAGAVVGDAQTALGFAQDAFGDTGVDTSGLAGRQEMPTGAGWDAAGAGLKGAAAGAKYGIVGAGIGAAIGIGSSILGSNAEKKAVHEGNMNSSTIAHNNFTNDFKHGGFAHSSGNALLDAVNSGQVGQKLIPNMTGTSADYHGAAVNAPGVNPNPTQIASPTSSYSQTMANPFNSKVNTPITGGTDFNPADPYTNSNMSVNMNPDINTKPGLFKRAGNWLNDNEDKLAGVARLAPIIGNGIAAMNLEKATPTVLDRTDARYKTNPVDERALENRIQNEGNNAQRALAGASNGSMGALRSNLLGAGLNKTKATSDAFIKAGDINRQEGRAAQQFNARQDMFNIQQSNREKEIGARDEGAYNSAKGAYTSAMLENIGALGKEATQKDLVGKLTGYSWDGKYLKDKDGNTVPDAQAKLLLSQYLKEKELEAKAKAKKG